MSTTQTPTTILRSALIEMYRWYLDTGGHDATVDGGDARWVTETEALIGSEWTPHWRDWYGVVRRAISDPENPGPELHAASEYADMLAEAAAWLGERAEVGA
jgi:hypothetical protein